MKGLLMPEHDDHFRTGTTHTERVTLAPCPFCGGALVDLGHTSDAAAFVVCNVCLASGPLSGTDEEAVWLWNTRVPPEVAQDTPSSARSAGMLNDRPLQDARTQEALTMILLIMRDYNLAGAVCVVNEHEAGFGYQLYTTFNAVVEDDTLPLGLRFRLKTAEQGEERAHQLALGTGHMLHQLKDFGTQTDVWMGDLLHNLAKAGMTFFHRPFGGRKLPRLTSEPSR